MAKRSKKRMKKKKPENKIDRPKKKRSKCGVIPGSPACDKQAKNKGRYCKGCEDNKIQ